MMRARARDTQMRLPLWEIHTILNARVATQKALGRGMKNPYKQYSWEPQIHV